MATAAGRWPCSKRSKHLARKERPCWSRLIGYLRDFLDLNIPDNLMALLLLNYQPHYNAEQEKTPNKQL